MQCQLGRCWYEKVDYPQARLAFESARRREAHRLEVRTACLPANIKESLGQGVDSSKLRLLLRAHAFLRSLSVDLISKCEQ